tara:strand:- start:385 stop:1263 length:879 start_codon:yes stop_codon:yes gene_type:complete
MPRIIDKDTRLIDIDFGPVSVTLSRDPASFEASVVNYSRNGAGQIIREFDPAGFGNGPIAGSFIQFSRIDLNYMTMNNEIYVPTDVSVQRTSAVPTGSSTNGNYHDDIEEIIYVFSRPLNNDNISVGTAGTGVMELLRNQGLDLSEGGFGGVGSGIPSHDQTIYAEKRTYTYSSQNIASINSGEIDPAQAAAPPAGVREIAGPPKLTDVTTWGTMSGITGPNLYAYRIVTVRCQNLTNPSIFLNVPYGGLTQLDFPPVNITFLAKDGNYTEGEYLTRLANAMNNIPEGGPTA